MTENNEQYEYHFERLHLKSGIFGTKFDARYQEIIRTKAREGWRFVQAFAPATVGYGQANCVELIFERRKNS